MRSPPRRPRRRGVTLPEVLIAVTILSFALLPLMGFLRTGTRGVRGTRDAAAAAFLAGQALEGLRAWDWERLCDEDPPDPEGRPSAEEAFAEPGRSEFTLDGVAFRREVDVAPLADVDGPPAKIATVRVEWTRKETPLHYSVTTVIARAP